MIYLTGDTHGKFKRFDTENFPEQKDLTKDDYVIIVGDFGGIWQQGDAGPGSEGRWDKYQLDKLEDKPFTLLFIDGNHENFDQLNSYPVKEWHGGKVHEIRPHILHLMRGQVFELNGKKIFTFGGAESHDEHTEILRADDPELENKKAELDKSGGRYRIENIDWWSKELPTKEEMDEGMNNLARCDFMVDYILTHCAPTSTQLRDEFIMKYKFQPRNVLTDYLDEIRSIAGFKRWFYGHYHKNDHVANRETMIHDQIIKLI